MCSHPEQHHLPGSSEEGEHQRPEVPAGQIGTASWYLLLLVLNMAHLKLCQPILVAKAEHLNCFQSRLLCDRPCVINDPNTVDITVLSSTCCHSSNLACLVHEGGTSEPPDGMRSAYVLILAWHCLIGVGTVPPVLCSVCSGLRCVKTAVRGEVSKWQLAPGTARV